MDWLGGKDRILEYIKKYRYVLIVLLTGVILMVIPVQEDTEVPEQVSVIETPTDLQTELENILCHVSGAGTVKVLLTKAAGEQTVYQTDEDISEADIRRDTVIVSNSTKEEVGLVKQVNPPVYLGAIVLCQGADDANVRLAIVKAVMSVTGLTSDHITVLKMK